MKRVFLIMALFAISFAGKAQQNYDFSAVSETGVSLYYRITSDANRTVEVVYPHVEGDYWGGYTKPTGSLIIPSCVTQDGVDYTVVSIGEFAFYECTGLTAVTVGDSICAIYTYAFSNCSNLSSVELPDQMYKIGDRAFARTALTGIVLPSGLLNIDVACFWGCNSLVSITIPENVTEIGRMAFQNCQSLQSVTFNDSLQKIWDSAFENCSSLTEIEIPNSVAQIRWSAFRNCTNLSTVTIGKGVTEIQQYAFMGCSALETVNFNAINCTVNDEASFCDSPRFKNLNIGEEVQLIDDFAFTNCDSITKLVIPNSVTTIMARAFKDCRSLDTIEIGSSLQSLADDAFAYCGDSLLYISVDLDNPYFDTRNDCNALIRTSSNELVLGSVNTIIPDGIISIGNYAFANHRMTSINIPNTIQTIGNESFNCCYLLDTIISEAMTPPLAYPTTFNGCGIHYDDFESTNVYVPYGTSQLYRNATGWNYFSNFIERGMIIGGAEWFYEIQNDNGSITYQQLQCSNDTVIENKRPKIIIRSNTLYDEKMGTVVTHEYVYEENGIVYWWNKT
ncbi:MAG: leucine-rich repeat domain-containing protein, partial [bacterium]|nr:leucine-rich repeat domain-containing protein [Candidatus Limimorpha equi]